MCIQSLEVKRQFASEPDWAELKNLQRCGDVQQTVVVDDVSQIENKVVMGPTKLLGYLQL